MNSWLWRQARRWASVGSPSAGKLIKGRVLPKHEGYEIRARERAYAQLDSIEFRGMHFRKDIGHKALARLQTGS